MFKTANNDSISRPNSRPKLPFPGNGKGKFKMPREGKGREIWGLYSRESQETGIPAHPCYDTLIPATPLHLRRLFLLMNRICFCEKPFVPLTLTLRYLNKQISFFLEVLPVFNRGAFACQGGVDCPQNIGEDFQWNFLSLWFAGSLLRSGGPPASKDSD